MQGLGRLPQFDQRSRSYPIRALLAPRQQKPRSYTWACGMWLDQGQTPECVGHAWAHENAAKPKVRATDEALAHALYRQAQTLDQWPGVDYEGTSVLAGAKAMAARSLLLEYRWAFGLDDLILAVSHHGPAVLGINWRDGMWDTDDSGYVHASGSVVGGHAILCRAVSLPRQALLLHNSWGRTWGVNGCAWLSFTDAASLLADDGEACVPVRR
jgi:hypothetical protein